MQFLWSWKKLPELQGRTRKEYYQAIWQVGLKPLRHWPVWIALLLSTLLAWLLLNVLLNYFAVLTLPEHIEYKHEYVWALLALLIPLRFLYLHTYLAAVQPYLPQARFSSSASWWGAFLKSSLVGLVPLVLILSAAFSIDWAVNSYDEELDPRVVAFKAWPEPIPDEVNGFVAMAGLKAPAGASPLEAGRAWIAAVNEATLKRAGLHISQPENLEFVAYAAKPRAGENANPPGKKSYSTLFCSPTEQPCWDILRQERREVTGWLAANKELLAHYQPLHRYPRWQNSILMNAPYQVTFPYRTLMNAQSLLHATAMLAIEKGQAGRGMEMMAQDIRFVRNMLAGKDTLSGKMVARSMLIRDLAWLVETLQEYPQISRDYRTEIEQMVAPLTARHLSMVDAYRFEEQWRMSYFECLADYPEKMFNSYNVDDLELPLWRSFWSKWQGHHLKKNATRNWEIESLNRLDKQAEITQDSVTAPLPFEFAGVMVRADALAQTSAQVRWPWYWYYNQFGRALSLRSIFEEYGKFRIRMFEMNGFNNLVRLQLLLNDKKIAAANVPAYLSASDQSLWNPLTGKPFEWDAERMQIYFVPVSRNDMNMGSIGGVKGRVGLTVR